MIKWLARTLIIALVVAGALILYLSPSLRSQAVDWLKEQKALVEKRIKQTKKLWEKKAKKEKKELFKKTQKAKKEVKKKVEELKAGAEGEPMEKSIPEEDKKKLEEILEKAQEQE